MSLLLDALKRSEKARQEKAAQEAGDGPAETREFSLESLEEEAKDPRNQPEPRAPRDDRPRVAETVERSAVMGSEDMDESGARPRASLDDTNEGFPDLEIVHSPPAETADRGVDPRGLGSRSVVGATKEGPAFSLMGDEPPDADPVADTGGTMPSEKAVRGAMDQYFDGTHSVSLSMREVRRAMDSEEREEREASGEHAGAAHTSTTQRRARTVVEARTAASRARAGSGTWVWALLVLLVGGLAAGGGWYYYTTVLGGGSPLFAGGQPPPRAALPPQPQPMPSAQPDTPVLAITAPLLQPAPMPEPPVRGDVAPAAETTTTEVPTTIEMPAPPVTEVVMDPLPMDGEQETLEPHEVADRLAAAIQSAGISTQGTGIRISKVSRKDNVSPTLTRAFEAFQRGDDVGARESWQAVLARNPGNRDALLGLAAIAVRAGQPREAAELYLRVLQAKPRDRLAQASLIAISDRLDPVEAESRIKLLLDGGEQAPYLHFILGNLYATQSRWALAQEAYFNAYRLDSSNADYVFNLAVSLDHLAQSPAALGLYQRALQLSDSRPVGFEPASVMNRIRVMTADAAGQ